jgi:hypothetical protein
MDSDQICLGMEVADEAQVLTVLILFQDSLLKHTYLTYELAQKKVSVHLVPSTCRNRCYQPGLVRRKDYGISAMEAPPQIAFSDGFTFSTSL